MDEDRRLLYSLLIDDIRESKSTQWKILALTLSLYIGIISAIKAIIPISGFTKWILGGLIISFGVFCAWIIINLHKYACKARQRLLNLDKEIVDEVLRVHFSGYNPPKYSSFFSHFFVPAFQALVVITGAILSIWVLAKL